LHITKLHIKVITLKHNIPKPEQMANVSEPTVLLPTIFLKIRPQFCTAILLKYYIIL